MADTRKSPTSWIFKYSAVFKTAETSRIENPSVPIKGLRAFVFDLQGRPKGSGVGSYPTRFPQPSYAEQEPGPVAGRSGQH
jgi:hypothetical protein